MKRNQLRKQVTQLLQYCKLYFQQQPVSIKSFDTSPTLLVEGGIILLKWEVQNAWKIEITPLIGDVSNRSSIAFSAKFPVDKFTLVAHGINGLVSKTLLVEIKPLNPQLPTSKPSIDRLLIGLKEGSRLSRIKPLTVGKIYAKFQPRDQVKQMKLVSYSFKIKGFIPRLSNIWKVRDQNRKTPRLNKDELRIKIEKPMIDRAQLNTIKAIQDLDQLEELLQNNNQ